MYSACVIFHENFDFQQWTTDEFDSLRFLVFKFDLFLLPSASYCINLTDWQRANFKLQRVIPTVDAKAIVSGFATLESAVEPVANVDIFINFPEDLRAKINGLFPHRTFMGLGEVLSSIGPK